jgi:UDP-N-acetylmuramate: L-alanyl-gamma-D-glutamyl-meso-diaminopimelate ligase
VGGAHNVENALGVAAAATALGLSPAEIAAGLGAFKGVKRRQEVRGTAGGVTVIDDFAHHPRAVKETLAAIRGRFPAGRILAAFEPRSNTSRRNLHQRDYAAASTWGPASEVFLLQPAPTASVPESERLDVAAVARDLSSSGMPARVFGDVEAMVPAIAAAARPGDVLVAMSNGAFGGIWGKVLEALAR